MTMPTAEELRHMTVKELRELAKELPGTTGIHAMKKEELVTLLAAGTDSSAASGGTDAHQEAKRPNAGKKPLTKGEIRSRLGELHKAQEGARAANDKTKAAILRRRINRLKKQSRKPQPAL